MTHTSALIVLCGSFIFSVIGCKDTTEPTLQKTSNAQSEPNILTIATTPPPEFTQRVEALRSQDNLTNALLQTHRADDSRGRPALIAATAHALESGVPESGVVRLLSDPNTDRPGWLMGAIEGLETLHAQGFPALDAERLMVEALSRGMRRYELLQAIDLALRKQRDGTDPATIKLDVTPPAPGTGGRGNGGPHRPR